MRDAFWSVLHDCKFKEIYLEKYYTHASRIDAALSIITACISAASISAWAIWKVVPIVWSILLMVAQAIQVIRPYLPYSRRLAALKHFIPEIRHLVLEIEIFWYKSDAEDDPQYLEPLREFRKRYIDMECKYLGSDPLPSIKRLHRKADDETARHLQLFFGASEGDETSAKET